MKRKSKELDIINMMESPVTAIILTIVMCLGLFIFHLSSTLAASTPQFSQTINAGSLGIDIVDASSASVASPAVTFGSMTFDFDAATTTGTLGTASEKMRVSNPTATASWTLALAATSGNTTRWSDAGSNFIDFNDTAFSEDGSDTDSTGGRLAVDPSGGTIAGVSGCSATNVSLGSSSSFDEGTTDSITVMSANGSASTFCRWDLTAISLTQSIPAGQSGATYTLDMTLTAS